MFPSAREASPRRSSEYGSDIVLDDDLQLCDLLEDIEEEYRAKPRFVLESLDDNVPLGYTIVPAGLHSYSSYPGADQQDEATPSQLDHESVCFDSTALARETTDRARRFPRTSSQDESIPDTRTPLERFRTTPKKPLSVTDLVSPAWCELQYWYTLTKFGKKRATPAMKQGSSVHKKLEEEVHKVVPIEVQTREDSWGLKIWNIIMGLRTLNTTGLTRELEVWGVIDGQVVNGVIDELSFTCNELVLEARLSAEEGKKAAKHDSNQSTISQFFKDRTTSAELHTSSPTSTSNAPRQVYLTDVKTRASATVPAGASLKPTLMQLMLYRRLLSDLATNAVHAEQVFARYRLDPDVPFSDNLIAQIGSLDQISSQDSTSSIDTVTELLSHNSLQALWGLMINQFQLTFPQGPASISRILRADFRHARDGSVIGTKSFLYDETKLQAYLADEMSWWKGEREARGVDVEEAFKCRSCEFADTCTWRNAKVDEAVQRSRARNTTQHKTTANATG